MIGLTKLSLDKKEIHAVEKVIQSGWVTQGPKVKELEEKFARYVGSRYAVCVSSCTTALHLSLLTLGARPGDVVITVSHSFIATANSIRYVLCEPVFVDIDLATFNMDVAKLEKFITENCIYKNGQLYYKSLDSLLSDQSPLSLLKNASGRIAAILVVHQMGFPAELAEIIKIAKKHHIPVIEDAACAIGSEIAFKDGLFEKIGKPHGDIACFSFHPRKLLTTGDGGIITTNNKIYDKTLRLLRQHYMSTPDTTRHDSKEVLFETYDEVGYNFRLTDIQAAIGIEQLKKVDGIIKKRLEVVRYYEKLLKSIPWVQLVTVTNYNRPNWQSYPISIKGHSLSQKKLMQYLLDHAIVTRRGVMNAHEEKPYRHKKWVLPQSEWARKNTILLPLHHELTKKDIKFIVKVLSKFKI